MTGRVELKEVVLLAVRKTAAARTIHEEGLAVILKVRDDVYRERDSSRLPFSD